VGLSQVKGGRSTLDSSSVAHFVFDLERELLVLYDELEAETDHPGPYSTFTNYEGKTQPCRNRAWAGDGDITFTIAEHVAWEMNELAEEEDHTWACFAPELVSKPNDSCWSIV
jgi:hypothetical protein